MDFFFSITGFFGPFLPSTTFKSLTIANTIGPNLWGGGPPVSTVLLNCAFLFWYGWFFLKNRRCRMYTDLCEWLRYILAVLSMHVTQPTSPLVFCPDVLPNARRSWMVCTSIGCRSNTSFLYASQHFTPSFHKVSSSSTRSCK